MNDPLAHIDIELHDQLINDWTDALNSRLDDSNDFDHSRRIADRENLPQSMADAPGFQNEDSYPIAENSRVYDITRNAYIWINRTKSTQLINDFKNNKSKNKYFLVSSYISDEDLNNIKRVTDIYAR